MEKNKPEIVFIYNSKNPKNEADSNEIIKILLEEEVPFCCMPAGIDGLPPGVSIITPAKSLTYTALMIKEYNKEFRDNIREFKDSFLEQSIKS